MIHLQDVPAKTHKKMKGNIENMKRERTNQGITLIALVITIIILLILAGISIVMLTGNNGLLTKASIAGEETKKATYKEVLELLGEEIRPEKILENLTTKDFMDRYQGKIDEEIKKRDILKDATQERKNDETIYVTTKEGWIYKITETKVEVLGKKGENPTPDLQDTDIELETNPEKHIYTQGNVKVKIIVTNPELKKYTLQYSKDGQNWSNYTGEFEVTENGPIHAKLINELGEEGASATKEISNIDREDPNEAEITITNNTADNSVTAKVKQSDNISGVDIEKCKWVYTQSNKTLGTEEEKYTGGSFKTNPEDITIKDYIAGTYYLHVLTVDKVGRKTETMKEVKITRDSVAFSKDYGRIEVVWLDTEDNIIPEPNEPKLMGMTRVKWNGTEEANPTSNDGWYAYKAGAGTNDNNSSEWANAKMTKNGADSYFVWIPRYAYRITYYESETSNKVTGYCDGKGMRTVNGEVQQTISNLAKSVEVNGKSYIVHPAFRNGTANKWKNGEWDSELSGIWVGKYKTSRNDATATSQGSGSGIKIVPGVRSLGNFNIGVCYTNAYNFDRNKESHLMKNSEWGAVAYLTQSQYGRNGHEIDINNSSSNITGNGGGSTNASSSSEITNAYNTVKGAKASTTGNIYGIYDMSGGAQEYMAAYISNGVNSGYGNSFASATTNLEGYKTLSTKYATVYPYKNASSTDADNYNTYKNLGYGYGDAILETSWGSGISSYNWFDDYNHYPVKAGQYFQRGGGPSYGLNAGLFYFSRNDGYAGNNGSTSYRVVLIDN